MLFFLLWSKWAGGTPRCVAQRKQLRRSWKKSKGGGKGRGGEEEEEEGMQEAPKRKEKGRGWGRCRPVCMRAAAAARAPAHGA